MVETLEDQELKENVEVIRNLQHLILELQVRTRSYWQMLDLIVVGMCDVISSDIYTCYINNYSNLNSIDMTLSLSVSLLIIIK